MRNCVKARSRNLGQIPRGGRERSGDVLRSCSIFIAKLEIGRAGKTEEDHLSLPWPRVSFSC